MLRSTMTTPAAAVDHGHRQTYVPDATYPDVETQVSIWASHGQTEIRLMVDGLLAGRPGHRRGGSAAVLHDRALRLVIAAFGGGREVRRCRSRAHLNRGGRRDHGGRRLSDRVTPVLACQGAAGVCCGETR